MNPGISTMATTTLSNTAAVTSAATEARPCTRPAIVKVSAPSGVLKAPDLPSASGPGEIVALQLQNNTGSAQKPGEVTFGHVFRQGDLDAGKHLTAVIGGREVPVQMDVKATHPDGSVRHALLTIDQPGLDAGEKATAMLKTAGAGPSGATIKPADILAKGYDVDINLDLKGANGAVTHFKVDAAAELAKAAADGTLKTWMSGPLASEYRVVKAVNDHLNVTLDIRAFKDGSVRTDVIMGVESSYKPGLQNFYNYDIEVRDHNSVAYAKDDIAHYRNSRWHKEVWSGGEPDVHVAQDVDYMKSTGAVVGIDSSMGVTPGSVGAAVVGQDGTHGQRHDFEGHVAGRRPGRSWHHADLERPLSGKPERAGGKDHARQRRRRRQHPVALPRRGDRRLSADRPAPQPVDGRTDQLAAVRR